MPRKVLRSKFRARCLECNHIFELNKAVMKEREIELDMVPFSARSSHTTLLCPNCKESIDFNIFFDYKNVYRLRCHQCNKMFDSQDTTTPRCPECRKKRIETMAQMGPG